MGADLLTASERESFESPMEDLFETFKDEIIIHVQPIANISTTQGGYVPGYGANPDIAITSYTPVFRSFYGLLKFGDFNAYTSDNIGRANLSGKVYLEVKQDAYDFIMANKVERIEINKKFYNVESQGREARFLNKIYYIFELQFTQ